MIKRDEVKQKLINMGVAEPTEEMVNDYLSTISNELKSAEDKATRYKAEADRVKDLERELKELNDANLSETEKQTKAFEEANAEITKLRQTVKEMELSNALAEIGIKGEDADGLFTNGELNTVKLGEIITSREKNAVAAYQKETLNSTPSPQGGKNEDDVKPEVEYAKEYVARNSSGNTQSIINQYT